MRGIQLYLFLMFTMFTFLMSLRALSVGVDTAPYSRIYGIIINSGSYKNALTRAPLSAPIYILICKILGSFSSNPQILIVFSSLFVNTGLFVFIMRVSDDVVMSTFCWMGLALFYCSMNGNRQCMALVLVLNALVYLTHNIKSIKGWILVLIALGIHSTCLISLVAIAGIIIANKLKENQLIFIVSAIGSVMASILLNKIIPLFLRLFPRYSMYVTGESPFSIFVSNGGGRIVLVYIFLLGICIVWLLTNKNSNISLDVFHSKMFPAVIFCSFFGILNCKNELINRMLWFYIAIFISFIPASLKKYRGIVKFALQTGIIVVLGAYSIFSLLENHNGVVPYTFFGK
ncbi:EpsG family protein [Lacrimispora sp. BS-2]|uniref:EpsG family protein n=1 Tax=Lacrimispora sp. BS-2 TaxID=3151850 RepID=A0AAU7PNK2_9FIRM